MRSRDTVRMCWMPFCDCIATGTMTLVMGQRRDTVQACDEHKNTTRKAGYTFSIGRKTSDEPARRR